MEAVGRRVLRNFMPDQHREFFAGLPFLVLGARDAQGQVWASIVSGAPGFASTPDATTLRIRAQLRDADPLAAGLEIGADIGILGIDFAARRRNRANGLIAAIGEDGFDVAVRQSFGNCPKYIQARDWTLATDAAAQPSRLIEGNELGWPERELIARADTFFIASALGSFNAEPSQGIDASHRGGKPGFVRVDGARTLTVPDYSGNAYYNTLGNLVLEPHCGLLLIDFDRGTALQVAAEAEIIWQGNEVKSFAGAQRLVRFHVSHWLRTEGAVPLRWRFLGYSPFLESLGDQREARG
ncbi:MAG TPA: pyridoxamine 5'-phosphate oxidase family protein [Stellaceae bacterium]